MAVDDLCTVEYVIRKGGIQGTLFNDRIADLIADLSEEIRFDVTGDANDQTLTSANLNCKRACTYGVLAEMEKQKLISSTKNVTSTREGNIAVTYDTGVSSKVNYSSDLSFEEKYAKYMGRLLPIPPIGSKSRCKRW